MTFRTRPQKIMKSTKDKLIGRINIDPEHWDVPMRVPLRPYLEFNRRIACQLRELVERWQGFAPGKPSNSPGNRRNTKR
jgi:hypothetical protein